MVQVLAFRSVRVVRGGSEILADIDWQVHDHERWVVLGPNGAGKTTLLQLAGALIHPTSGHVEVLGETLGSVDVFDLRPRIGLASAALADRIPAEEKVRDVVVTAAWAVTGRWREQYEQSDLARAGTVLQLVGAEGLAERVYGTLSEGERKRVQIARALMTDPELLLLDEPFSGLDPVNSEMVLELIKRYKREGRTVIFSTHVVEHAEQICDSIIIIDRGRRKVAGMLAAVKAAAERTVVLDYEGDAGALETYPGVIAADDAGQHAELKLAGDADAQALLQALVARVRIRRFDTREASLKQIFLDAVEDTHDAA